MKKLQKNSVVKFKGDAWIDGKKYEFEEEYTIEDLILKLSVFSDADKIALDDLVEVIGE